MPGPGYKYVRTEWGPWIIKHFNNVPDKGKTAGAAEGSSLERDEKKGHKTKKKQMIEKNWVSIEAGRKKKKNFNIVSFFCFNERSDVYIITP